MLIKTSGIEYDDRLRKESISLSQIGAKIKIIALEDVNTKTKGISKYNIQYNTICLFTRKLFPQRKFLIIKMLEMNLKFLFKIICYKPEILWVHNFELIGMFPFARILKKIGIIKYIIWDHHELISKEQLDKRKLTNRFIKYTDSCK